MLYIISRIQVTKARYAVDKKDHRRTVYYGGRDSFGGFGIETWGKRADAYKFTDRRTAERYARALGGKVVEVKGQ